MGRAENVVQRALLEYLQLAGFAAFRVNNTGVWDPKNKIFRKSANVTPGVADIIACKHGRFYAVEAKAQGGKQSKDQKAFQDDIEAHGGVYILAKSVADLERELRRCQ